MGPACGELPLLAKMTIISKPLDGVGDGDDGDGDDGGDDYDDNSDGTIHLKRAPSLNVIHTTIKTYVKNTTK